MDKTRGERIPLWQVDAFTDHPFAGNPAAVCLLPAPREEAWMQAVATEMNLSETAFLVPRGAPEEGWDLRWFTPAVEVELCGHATLGSAHVLWQTGALPPEIPARFRTASGLLTAERRPGGWIELDFPADSPGPWQGEVADVVAALGVEQGSLRHLGAGRFDLLVELPGEDDVRRLEPNLLRLARLPVRGAIVTAAASPGGEWDFVSRFFGPACGIPEDPVTGSAHCCLAPFWSARLGRDELTGYQASARGGVVRTRLEGDRVRLGGQAVTVLEGTLGVG